MKKTYVAKVVCYVTKGGKLLVFRHVDYSYEEVGIQVPAGSIRPGETPEQAALREVKEETGLAEFESVAFLGRQDYDISPYRYEVQNRHFFHLAFIGNTPERWPTEELHDGEQPPTRFECFWIDMTASHLLQSGQSAMLGCLFPEND
ncbi:MAG: NUDIX domain-containing protein [Cyanobacteria bacterium P01_A01_bin.3]